MVEQYTRKQMLFLILQMSLSMVTANQVFFMKTVILLQILPIPLFMETQKNKLEITNLAQL